jgi:hypothetical protein
MRVLARRYRTRDRATSARPGPGLFHPMALGYHLRRLGWHQGHGSDIDGGRRVSLGVPAGVLGIGAGASRSAAERRPGPRAAAPCRMGQDSPLAVLIQRSGRLPPDRRA